MQSVSEITASAVLPVRLPKGFVIGSHVIDGWLRDGGMAAIYRARRSADDQRVAIKLQLPSSAHDRALTESFDREAEVLRRAGDCRHVVDLLEAGVLDDGRRYLVLEWVEGENLEELLDSLRNMDRRLPIVRACRICRDVARGLAELHEHGIVHLDLKPANVMVRPWADGRDEIKLVDLGIAADLRGAEGRAAHAPGAVVLGTSAYMAPEQARGRPADPSFDVYALGVLSFEAISGSSVPPHHWMPEALPRLETLRYGVPAALADLVQSCMDVDPERRPESAQRVASELVGIIGALEAEGVRSVSSFRESPVRTGQTEVAPWTSVPTRRPWARWVVLGAAASLLVGGIGLGRGGGDTGPSESTRAEGHGTVDERADPRHAPAVEDAALASGRSPGSRDAGEGPAAAKRARSRGEGRRAARSSESCRKKRTQAEHAKAKRQWREVLRMTAASGCWTSAAQRIQCKRLRVEAYAELREYARCVGEGDGSRDDEVLQGVRYCRMKLAEG